MHRPQLRCVVKSVSTAAFVCLFMILHHPRTFPPLCLPCSGQLQIWCLLAPISLVPHKDSYRWNHMVRMCVSSPADIILEPEKGRVVHLTV